MLLPSLIWARLVLQLVVPVWLLKVLGLVLRLLNGRDKRRRIENSVIEDSKPITTAHRRRALEAVRRREELLDTLMELYWFFRID